MCKPRMCHVRRNYCRSAAFSENELLNSFSQVPGWSSRLSFQVLSVCFWGHLLKQFYCKLGYPPWTDCAMLNLKKWIDYFFFFGLPSVSLVWREEKLFLLKKGADEEKKCNLHWSLHLNSWDSCKAYFQKCQRETQWTEQKAMNSGTNKKKRVGSTFAGIC